MIAILNGDIINSRKLPTQDLWITPLKKFLKTIGETPQTWEISRGDFFQVEIQNPLESLKIALQIKALIKSILIDENKRISDIDVRLSIGIGSKNYTASKISESNGQAFVLAGEKFERLKKEKTNLAVQTPWSDFDIEVNLYLKLASISIDKWSVSSAELIQKILSFPDLTQEQIGNMLGIEQNSVSGRWKRANADEIIVLEQMFKKKLQKKLV